MRQLPWKRISTAGLSALLLVSALAGCSSSSSSETSSSSSQAASGSASSSQSAVSSDVALSGPALPLEDPLTITIFSNFNAKFVGKVEDYNDIPFVKWWREQTGADIQFETVPICLTLFRAWLSAV